MNEVTYTVMRFADFVAIEARFPDGTVRSFNENKDNADYQQFLLWLDSGNQPEEIMIESGDQ